MNEEPTIGPLLACAIGDATGAGFEYAAPAFVKKHNNLKGYVQHQKWESIKPGDYTDDTQMALALCEHLLDDAPMTPGALASRFVEAFHRDPRTGYAGSFYTFLLKTETGEAFLDGIQPHSNKSGGAMRAFPIGFLSDAGEVRDFAMFQASLTHATFDGMRAAAVAALAFHHRYHRVGSKDDLIPYITKMIGIDFSEPWEGKVGGHGLHIVHAALTAFVYGSSTLDVLHKCVAYTGDVDTVAAIAMPWAAVCDETDTTMNDALYSGLEDGTYGRTYIEDIDQQLKAKFPPAYKRKADLDAVRQAKRDAKAAKPPAPAVAVADDDEMDLNALLFGDD